MTSKNTYQSYLHADSALSFPEFLGIKLPECECSSRGYRFYRTRYSPISNHPETITGDWCNTKSLAKASYKKALANARSQQ